MSLSSVAIKEHALQLGFAAVGVVPAVRLEAEGERLRQWLELGFAGTMGWMERSFIRRIDPSEAMPEVRSVVCVAMNYFTNHPMRGTAGSGKISRYAWGEDYHEVLQARLGLLLEWIREREPHCLGRIAVDSSPAMDKAWAVRAGLGWIGKHSNVINPGLGSWIFLGELFLSIELGCGETPVTDHCGTCTLCLASCPTGAIVEPYVVDARKCISYQTIEFRGPDLEVDTEGWLFGCDICQDVCPWNSFAEESPEAAFEPREGLVNPQLDAMARMTPGEFTERFNGSAILRTKHAGWVRNARSLLEDRAPDALTGRSADGD